MGLRIAAEAQPVRFIFAAWAHLPRRPRPLRAGAAATGLRPP
jgi:hypothetical protein